MDTAEVIIRLKFKLQQSIRDFNFQQSESSKIYNKIEIETYKTAIKALEKQVPKKPIIDGDYNPAECPCCGAELSEFVGDGVYKHWYSKKMCDCGQKIDWS
jgi:hypothetical protein